MEAAITGGEAGTASVLQGGPETHLISTQPRPSLPWTLHGGPGGPQPCLSPHFVLKLT